MRLSDYMSQKSRSAGAHTWVFDSLLRALGITRDSCPPASLPGVPVVVISNVAAAAHAVMEKVVHADHVSCFSHLYTFSGFHSVYRAAFLTTKNLTEADMRVILKHLELEGRVVTDGKVSCYENQ